MKITPISKFARLKNKILSFFKSPDMTARNRAVKAFNDQEKVARVAIAFAWSDGYQAGYRQAESWNNTKFGNNAN